MKTNECERDHQVLMMTLQNEPPSVESVSEYEDQYKNYGKSVRKLIIECLQKDPAKRPTASELLKHPFIKKAKDRRYLMQTLLPNTPSFAERSRRALDAKRGSGFDSGNDGGSGSWVWPQDDVANQQILGESMFINTQVDFAERHDASNNVGSTIHCGAGAEGLKLALEDAGGQSQSCSGSSVTSSNATDGAESSLKSNDLYDEQHLVIDRCTSAFTGQQLQREHVNQMPQLVVASQAPKPKQQLQRSKSCDDSSNANNQQTTNQQPLQQQQREQHRQQGQQQQQKQHLPPPSPQQSAQSQLEKQIDAPPSQPF